MPSLPLWLRRRFYLGMTAAIMPYRRAVDRYALVCATRTEVEGVAVWIDERVAGEAAELIERVAAGLRLLREIDPRRFGWLARRVGGVFVRVQEPFASYWIDRNLITLSAADARTMAPVRVAITLVHEMMHARIQHAGVPWVPDLFHRIESRCVKAEIAFCEKLRAAGWDADATIARYRALLTRSLAPPVQPRLWIKPLLYAPYGWMKYNLAAWSVEARRRIDAWEAEAQASRTSSPD